MDKFLGTQDEDEARIAPRMDAIVRFTFSEMIRP